MATILINVAVAVAMGLIQRALAPDTQGPRLSDLKLQNSNYGGMLPILYGSRRMSGNVIWQTDLQEHSHKSGGKGGPTNTTYTYSASFAIALCEGEIASIEKVWADGRLVFNRTESTDDFTFVTYYGTADQTADPTMEALEGVGNVPGYRGVAYVVFTDLDLSEFGNRIPNLEFLVTTLEPESGPIVKIAANYDVGANADLDLEYADIFFGTTAAKDGFPRLVEWTTAIPDLSYGNSFIRLRLSTGPTANDGLITTFEPTTFGVVEVGLAPDTETDLTAQGGVVIGSAPIYRHAAVGQYLYADASTADLYLGFASSHDLQVGTTDTGVALYSAAPTNVGNVPFGPNFAAAAGLVRPPSRAPSEMRRTVVGGIRFSANAKS